MKLQKEMILLNQSYENAEEVIRKSGELLVSAGCVDEEYVAAMIERNEMVSTYMGNFIAIPHGTDEAKKYVKKSGISIIQVPAGVDFAYKDEQVKKIDIVLFGYDLVID